MQRTIFTSADLELLPDDGTRYEIIDGELIITRWPHWEHQAIAGNIYQELRQWSLSNGQGRVSLAPGVIFSDTDNVIPDVAWVSIARFAALLDEAGHLTGAPELVVEVLSPGLQNEQRDRETKRKLYEVRGVQEYWVVDWRIQQVEIYRREQALLRLTATLFANDTLTTPLLPGFACPIARIFS
ncbi:MAG: Uma2 family endonuclease [Roseiflexaceae bacterium]|nr:Uma2 family endonuclease [Roseiflexaceae bacterium]